MYFLYIFIYLDFLKSFLHFFLFLLCFLCSLFYIVFIFILCIFIFCIFVFWVFFFSVIFAGWSCLDVDKCSIWVYLGLDSQTPQHGIVPSRLKRNQEVVGFAEPLDPFWSLRLDFRTPAPHLTPDYVGRHLYEELYSEF